MDQGRDDDIPVTRHDAVLHGFMLHVQCIAQDLCPASMARWLDGSGTGNWDARQIDQMDKITDIHKMGANKNDSRLR